jgi:superfamily II DNA or RNA helicase
MKRERLSAKHRRRLFEASDGRCVDCGMKLTIGWHADHKEPFVVTGRTNLHEMQAMCGPCNLKKGKRMKKYIPRSHQAALANLLDQVVSGLMQLNSILVYVTPGGGKSDLPVIALNKLVPAIADKICWVVPRDGLKRQGEANFLNDKLLRFLSNDYTSQTRDIRNDARKVLATTGNMTDPSRGTNGYLTTYQAVATDPDLHAKEFRTSRYILVLDECQGVAVGSDWETALQPLMAEAVLVIYMGGVFSRHDGKQIAFLEYENGKPILGATPNRGYVSYSRPEALADRSILPIYPRRVDGFAEWLENGNRIRYESLRGLGDDNPKALRVVLREDYAISLLKAMLDDWRKFRSIDPLSKFLVVAPNITVATTYFNWLRAQGLGDEVGIATSEETADAKLNIRRFRGDKDAGTELRGLVTVGMAYIGLDVPAATHLACLTHFRSYEWLAQMIARVTRPNYSSKLPIGEQEARLWAPDDDEFSRCIEQMVAEQIDEISKRNANGGNGSGSSPRPSTIVGIDANLTNEREQDVDHGEMIAGRELDLTRKAAEASGLGHISASRLQQFLREREMAEDIEQDTDDRADSSLTESEKMVRIRRRIKKLVNFTLSDSDPEKIRSINSRLVAKFGKRREDMTLPELERVHEWLVGRAAQEQARAG